MAEEIREGSSATIAEAANRATKFISLIGRGTASSAGAASCLGHGKIEMDLLLVCSISEKDPPPTPNQRKSEFSSFGD